MPLEIEHKYLVINDDYLAMCDLRQTRQITQGYLNRAPERTVRIRITRTPEATVAFLTVKGLTTGDTRREFEYPVPVEDARAMLSLCDGNLIEKTRYIVPFGGHTWEVDIFGGVRTGLRVAEIELPESTHDYPLPPFCGPEVTSDPHYYNSAL